MPLSFIYNLLLILNFQNWLEVSAHPCIGLALSGHCLSTKILVFPIILPKKQPSQGMCEQLRLPGLPALRVYFYSHYSPDQSACHLLKSIFSLQQKDRLFGGLDMLLCIDTMEY